MTPVADVCILATTTIREAMVGMDRTGKGIALVVDSERRFIATITDGDIRRAIILELDLDIEVGTLLENQAIFQNPTPVTAPVGASEDDLLRLMNENLVRHLPIIDENRRVTDLIVLRDLVTKPEPSLRAVVMAGGYGNRLRPLTDHLPKPMLPVGDRPLMELIINQLRESGFKKVQVTTHYMGETIRRHFGDGTSHGVHISYIGEDEPMGTAGALCALEDHKEPILVINGDILTTVDFRTMLNFHYDHSADMTVAVKQQEIQIPYGVVETNGVDIMAISEKPVLRHFVNAGIYILSPGVCSLIPEGCRYDIPDLITLLIAQRYRVISFPVHEYWQDIGRLEDYERALAHLAKGEV